MIKPKVVQTITDKSATIYRVETTYPDSKRPENDNKFNSIGAYAFLTKKTVKKIETEKRRAGRDADMAIWTDREMFLDQGTGKYVTSTMDFSNPCDAFRVASFIRDKCRLLSGWEHGTDWEHVYRGKIKTRVVMISSRETVHEIKETMEQVV